MNLTNDDTLRNALHEAAARYEVPAGGAERILDASRSATRKAQHDDDGSTRSFALHWSRRRVTRSLLGVHGTAGVAIPQAAAQYGADWKTANAAALSAVQGAAARPGS